MRPVPRALQVGKPNILTDAQIKTVMEKFQAYGQPQPAICC